MLTMKRKAIKVRKAKGVATTAKPVKTPRSLRECEAWFQTNWDKVIVAAKANTKRLTGRECL